MKNPTVGLPIDSGFRLMSGPFPSGLACKEHRAIGAAVMKSMDRVFPGASPVN